MTRQLKIVSIGAAIQDVYLRGRIFEPHREEDGDLVEEFEFGSKNEVDAITHSTGGAATNTAVTFARMGLKSVCMARVGDDIAARAILDALRRENVDTSLMSINKKVGTGYSTILLAPNGERTVLTYRGASSEFDLNEKDFFGIAPDWFYVGALAGDLDSLEVILDYAEKHDIKVAVNPGKKELEHKSRLRLILERADIVSLNKEEAAMIFEGSSTAELAVEAAKKIPIVLITDGPKGSVACDGQNTYRAGMYEDVPVIDRLGAGDAFCSGFVGQVAQGETIQRALTYASANSTGVVSQIGTKAGIIHGNKRLHDMEIKVKTL